jgi:uncharacterized protein YcbK (DUF882 family)
MQRVHCGERSRNCNERERGEAKEIARNAQHLAMQLVDRIYGLFKNGED